MEKKVLSLLLALCMLLSLVPSVAFAAGGNYHDDDIIQSVVYDSSTNKVEFILNTSNSADSSEYRGEEIHSWNAFVYSLSSGTNVNTWNAGSTGLGDASCNCKVSVTGGLPSGQYLLVVGIYVDDNVGDDNYVAACKTFWVNQPQASFTNLTDYATSSTTFVSSWSDIVRKYNQSAGFNWGETCGYQPTATMQRSVGVEQTAEPNSGIFDLVLHGFVFGGIYDANDKTTVYQDQALYSVNCGVEGCVADSDHVSLAYRNVYYDVASYSNIHVFVKEHGADNNTYKEIASRQAAQVASGSNAAASYSDITWEFVDQTIAQPMSANDYTLKIAVNVPAGADVHSYDVKVRVGADVHMTDWYWANKSEAEGTFNARNTYNNWSAEAATDENSHEAETYFHLASACDCGNEHKCLPFGDNHVGAVASCTDGDVTGHSQYVCETAEAVFSVNPNRVAVWGPNYGKYGDPKPTNQVLNLNYSAKGVKAQDVKVKGGTKSTAQNIPLVESGENWAWYPKYDQGNWKLENYDIPEGTKNVLVLNNFWMEYDGSAVNPFSGGKGGVIYLPADTTIVLADGSTNVILPVNGSTYGGADMPVITCLGDLNIVGGGSLELVNMSNDSNWAGGIWAMGDLTVDADVDVVSTADALIALRDVENGSNKLTINGGNINVLSTGNDAIYGLDGVTIASGTVVAVSEDGSAICTDGKNCGGYADVVITGGVVLASGTDCGIAAASNTNISGGTVTATGKNGIGAKNNVIISGGSVEATSVGGGNGIVAVNNVTVSGGTVKATGHNEHYAQSYAGIFAVNGNVTVSGGDVHATVVSTNEADGVYGIYAPNGKVAISGGTVYATGTNLKKLGSHNDAISAGIFAKDLVDITGGKVTAVGGNVEAGYKAGSYGIVAADVNIANADVTATAGTASATDLAASVGISADYYVVEDVVYYCNATITNAKVVATGKAATGADECYSAGIGAAKYVTIASGSDVTVTATGDGIVASDTDVVIDNAKVTVTYAGDEGIEAGNNVVIKNGSTVTVTEAGDDGIFAKNNVSISGGCDVSVNSDDEGIIAVKGEVKATVTNLDIEAGKDGIKAKTGITVKATVASVTSLTTDAIFTKGDINIKANNLYVKSDADNAIETDNGDVTVEVVVEGKIVATTTGIKAENAATVKGAGALTIEAGADGIDANAVVAEIKTLNIKADGEGIIADTGSVTATVTNLNVNAKADGIEAKTGITVKATVATVTSLNTDAIFTLVGNVNIEADTLFVESENDDAIETDHGDVTVKGNKATIVANGTNNAIEANAGSVYVDVVNFVSDNIEASGSVIATATDFAAGNVIASGSDVNVKATSFVAGDIKANGNNGNVTVEANVATATNIEATAKATLSKNVTVTGNVNAENVEIKAGADVKAENVTAIDGITVNNGAKLTVEQTASATNVTVKAGSGSNTVLSANEVVAKEKMTVEGAYNNYVTATIGKATVDADTVTASKTSMKGNANVTAKTADLGTFTTIPASNPKGFYVQKAQEYTTNALYWREDSGLTSKSGLKLTGVSGGKFVFAPAGFAYKPVVSYGGGGGAAPVVTVTSSMPMLRKGNTGDAVKTLQTKLNALGYNCGAVDGVFGNDTYNAVVKYQKAMGITVDGVVGKGTWGKLGVTGTTVTVAATTSVTSTTTTSATSNMPMLRKGNTGDAVKTLQTKLNALGYNCGAVDGVFGTNTYNAVVKFQKDKSLSVDGVVGNQTWAKLG